jgi:hypothetical protein
MKNPPRQTPWRVLSHTRRRLFLVGALIRAILVILVILVVVVVVVGTLLAALLLLLAGPLGGLGLILLAGRLLALILALVVGQGISFRGGEEISQSPRAAIVPANCRRAGITLMRLCTVPCACAPVEPRRALRVCCAVSACDPPFFCRFFCPYFSSSHPTESPMNSIIYLVGLVVVVMAILSFVGIH